jgi:thiol-disulfide isomerase/thioredoxin
MQDDRKLKRQRQQSRHIRAGAPKNLLKVKTLEDFKRVVGNQKDQIVVVRWYAPWCKACKAIAPSYYRLATKFPNTLFVDIPVTPENANLHQGLGVPSLPYGHIYHPTGKLVEELKISRKYFPHFARTLMTYIEGRCKVDYDGDGVPFLKGNSKVSGKEKEDNNSTSSSSTSTVS